MIRGRLARPPSLADDCRAGTDDGRLVDASTAAEAHERQRGDRALSPVNWIRCVTALLARSIGAQILTAFGVTVALALLVALVSLSAINDTTHSLEQLRIAQGQMLTAIKDLELGAELQSEAVQAYLLSGDERYLRELTRGQALLTSALETLDTMTLADDGLDRLDAIHRGRERFEESAASQLVLYRQGWPRSATFLWSTDGRESKEQFQQQVDTYYAWYETAILEEESAAKQRAQSALVLSITLVLLAAVLGIVVGLRLTRSITSRLGTLAVEAQAIGSDDFSARAAISGSDEVAALGQAMNRMAEHLERSQAALEASQQKLRQSYEQYRLLAENAMDIVYALDVDGRYQYVNNAVERVTGWQPSQLLGRHFTEFLPESLRAARRESFDQRMRGDDVGNSAEIEFLAKDGHLVPLELRLAAIVRDGETVGMQGIARDMTRRLAMEAQIRRLAEQEHRRAEQLQEVARAGQSISRLTSLDDLLPSITTLLHEVFGYRRVALFLRDPGTDLASLRAASGDYAAPIPTAFSLARGQGIVGWVAANGEPVRVDDVRQDERYIELPATVGTRSELTVPIRAAGEVLGVIDVQSLELGGFDVNDEATLMILADHVGTAIQNARLFEQQHGLAVADERNRLAREIHDTLAQGLTAITLQLEVADAVLDIDAEQARQKLLKALELTRANLEEARRSVMDLRAAPLQDRTLPAALEELVSTFGQDFEVQTAFGCRNVSGRLPAATEAGLYRIAQEALNNIGKHADACSVQLTLEGEEGMLILTIQDDGLGFDPRMPRPERRKGGFGLIGMQERAKLLGGQLEVTSAPNEGTRIVVQVPTPVRRESNGVTAGKA